MKIALCLALAAGLAGCATHSPDVIRPYEAQRMSQVYDATVLSVRPVTIEGSQSGLGSTAGAVAGGVAGSHIGGYRESFVGAVVGAIVGGVVGNAVEREATKQNAVEIMVQLRNGERRAVVQANGNEAWAIGEPVLLVMTAGRTRVSRAPQIAPQAYPSPEAYPAPQPVPVYPPSGPVPPRS